MPSTHALLSPSSANRWIKCPGSIRLSQQLPEPKSSEYAEEGTRAHALAEAKLLRFRGDITDADLEMVRKEVQPDGEMEECTDFYVSVVEEIFHGAGADAQLLIEQPLSLEKWAPEGKGTADAIVVGGGCLRVIDLKYGKGIRISSKDNPQLSLYGLGAAELFEGVYDFDTIELIIIQPRLDHVSREEIYYSELYDWGENVVAPRAKEAYEGSDHFESGSWCRWCPAAGQCRAQADEALELARMDFKDPGLLDADEISEAMLEGKKLQEWLAAVEEFALNQALAGVHFDGWKLVAGRSNRKITDQIEAAKRLKEAGFDEAVLFKHELYGITQLEKNCGKKKLTEVVGDLIEKPQGKPVLVPESDKREAINSEEAARADFAD